MHLTQDEFAVKLGFAGSTIGYWESGEVTPWKRTRARVRAACSQGNPSRAPGRGQSARYSEKVRLELHAAIDLVFENGQDEIIKKAIDILSTGAINYRMLREAFGPPDPRETQAHGRVSKHKVRSPSHE